MGKHLTLYLNNIHLTKQLITVKKIKRKDIFTEDSKMKKLILVSMIAVTAMGMIGCGEDDSFDAAVTWQNESGTDVQDIRWVDENSVANARWDETVPNTDTSEQKIVTLETGRGECLDTAASPQEYEIEINGGSQSYTLTEGAAETLRITNIATKKK